MVKLVTLLVLASVACGGQQQEDAPDADSSNVSSVEQTGLQYLRAIEKSDWETMSSLLADQAEYVDHCATYFDRPPFEFTGREAIVKFWRDSADDYGVESMVYKIDESFVAGQTVTFILSNEIIQAGRIWKVDKDTIRLTGRHIMSIRIVDGKVVYHTDIVDYAGVMRQIAELKKQYGEIEE